MFRRKLLFISTVFLFLAVTDVSAATNNVIINGDFQTGNLVGWTVSCPGSVRIETAIVNATDRAISSGSTWAMINTQTRPSVTCDLYQDITIPAGATAASLTMRYALSGSNGLNGTESRRIDVTDTSGAVLVNIQPEVDRSTTRAFAPLSGPISLLAYSGQTVRIRARVSNTTINSSSANLIGIDDVVLTVTVPDPAPVPTISEWMLIFIGLIMATGTALLLHRRQSAGPASPI